MVFKPSLGSYVLGSALGLGFGISWMLKTAPKPAVAQKEIETPVKSKQRAVYAFGYGQFGQLMSGNESDSFFPLKVHAAEHVVSGSVDRVFASSKTSALLTTTGQVFTAGFAKDSRLGFTSFRDVTTPVQALPMVQSSHVSLGEFGGAVLTRKGCLYTWGRNWHKENGHPTSEPSLVSHSLAITDVSRGRQYTVFCDEEGSLYSLEQQGKRKLEMGEAVVVGVSCGSDFSLALTKAGNVFSWGRDQFGQLGLGEAFHGQVDSPQQISSLSNIREVVCGEHFSAAISHDGKLFMCGQGKDGQLGNGSTQDSASFQRVLHLENVAKVSCGGGHVAALLENGQLFFWGRGRNGQLGTADRIGSVASSHRFPVECTFFKGKRVLDVACGGDHTLVLVEEDMA